MLGWTVSVFRIDAASSEAERVAHWKTSVFGLEWLDDLVAAGNASDLDDNLGYPHCYGIEAGVLRSALAAGLPPNASPLVIGDDYALPSGWNGKLVIDQASLASYPADELLIIEAWDMS